MNFAKYVPIFDRPLNNYLCIDMSNLYGSNSYTDDFYHYDSNYFDEDNSSADYGYDETDTPLEPCPNCGEEIYEDAEQCPYCGEYVVSGSRPSNLWGKKSLIWIVIGILGVISTVIVLLFPW